MEQNELGISMVERYDSAEAASIVVFGAAGIWPSRFVFPSISVLLETRNTQPVWAAVRSSE